MLRKPFFFVTLVAFGLIVLAETGASFLLALQPATQVAGSAGADIPPGQLENPGGLAIGYLAFIDVIVFFTTVLMGAGILFSKRAQARLQGIVTLVAAVLLIITALVLLFIAIGKLVLMVGLLLAFPFGTIVYLILFGSFPRDAAAIVLSLIMFLKLVGIGFLVAAQQRFLENKGLVALLITSLAGNIVAAFLHGLVPGILVSITDAIAAIVFAIVGIIWAIILIVGSIPAIVRAATAKPPIPKAIAEAV